MRCKLKFNTFCYMLINHKNYRSGSKRASKTGRLLQLLTGFFKKITFNDWVSHVLS